MFFILVFFFGTISLNAQSNQSSSTRESVIGSLAQQPPRLTFDTTMTKEEMTVWRGQMKESMKRLMKHPGKEVKRPRKIGEAQREGYRIERWQSYPVGESGVNFYVLIPDGVNENNPAKGAVLCIPGFGQTKELLAGERWGNYELEGAPDSIARKSAMALHYVKEGLVAVAVDNPSFGELSDNGVSDYLNTSRILLEQDWSYLGLTSWQDKVVLDWLKKQPYANKGKLIVSGFSLGTEPLMVLGLLDEDIDAFIYNDFLCRTKERILVMDKPGEDGQRPFPNSIEHLIPGFLIEFDFPDIVAALSPRPVICTEGGLDRDFDIIRKAYEIEGDPEAFSYFHYAKFQDPENRQMLGKTNLPENLSLKEYFNLVNVDPPNHYLKLEYIIPWLHNILNLAD